RDKAAAELKQVEAELEDRATRSAKLRILLDVADYEEWQRSGRQGPKPAQRGGINPAFGTYLVKPLWQVLPPALVEHWPFVFLIVYATDLALLLMIGRVPLAYNFRYLWVRKRDTLLTALAFTVVVALVVVLLAFVNGMYKLNEGTGVPGNVFVLAEGATDELFSNLG